MATITQPAVEHRFEHLLLDFLSYLEFERGLSRNTLEAYRSDLLQFGRFLEARGLSALEAGPSTATCAATRCSIRTRPPR
jgi:integrase/recombinase XerD